MMLHHCQHIIGLGAARVELQRLCDTAPGSKHIANFKVSASQLDKILLRMFLRGGVETTRSHAGRQQRGKNHGTDHFHVDLAAVAVIASIPSASSAASHCRPGTIYGHGEIVRTGELPAPGRLVALTASGIVTDLTHQLSAGRPDVVSPGSPYSHSV